MTSTNVALGDAPERPGSKVVIAQTGSDRGGAPIASTEIRDSDANSSQSNVAPAILGPILSSDPVLRRPFDRTSVDGKFLSMDGKPFFVRGVTYGAFRPDAAGREYADNRLIEGDFAQMAAFGINTVRIPHTMPPRSVLDIAARHGLRVMVGLSAEQSAGYLIDRNLPRDFVARFRAKVRLCAGHPALLCVALGNEIMALMTLRLNGLQFEPSVPRPRCALLSAPPLRMRDGRLSALPQQSPKRAHSPAL